MILTMVHTQDSATYFRVISFTHDSGSFRKKNPPRRQTMPYASYATTLPILGSRPWLQRMLA